MSSSPLRCVVVRAVLGAWVGLAGAQDQPLPDLANALRQEQERIDARRQREEQGRDVVSFLPALDARRLPSTEAPCFLIRRLEIRLLPDAQLRQHLQAQDYAWLQQASAGPQGDDDPVGQCLGTQGIAQVIRRAQESLVRRGYVTTRVLAPEQDLSQGVLVLTLIPGTVNTVRFKDPQTAAVRLSNSLPLQPGAVLNLRDLEQGLENLQRVPTAQAQITVEPASGGSALAGNDVVVAYRQEAPARVSLTLDDSGSKSSGKLQGSATVSLDNPLQLSDLFYLTRSHDLGGGHPGPRGTRAYTVHYSLPLHYWNVSATHSGSNYHQSVAGKSQNYIYSGTSETSEIQLGRLVYRDSLRKMRIGLKAWHRGSKYFINGTEVRVQRRSVGGWALALNHSAAMGQSQWEGGLVYQRGTGDFDAIAAPEEAFNEGTAKFGLVTAKLLLSVPLQGHALRAAYRMALQVQDNTTRLTAQDRMAIGGRYSVRGFDGESSLAGERGWTLRNDWSVFLGDSGQEAFWALDAGEVAGPSAEALPGSVLRGAVLGVRGRYQKWQYECFVGTPLHRPSGFKTDETSAGFSLTLSL